MMRICFCFVAWFCFTVVEAASEANRLERGTHVRRPTLSRYGCPIACTCYLNIVYCSGKHLQQIPSVLPRTGQFLHLENNNITKIRGGDFLHFSSLQRIILTKNKLTNIGIKSRSFDGLTDLKRLDLSENRLTRFPRSLPPSLIELRLNDNNISRVKYGATRGLSNLVALSLYGNVLTDAGFNPGVLRAMSSLQYLDLSKNHLQTVPKDLPSNLTEIRMTKNRLKYVTDGIFTSESSLHHLYLRENEISDGGISENAWGNTTNLFMLDISENNLRIVPRGLPSSLRQIILENNKIEEIHSRTFWSSPNLTQIKLAFNEIRIITPNAFSRLQQLRFLDLAFNHLMFVPRELPKTLEALFLESNRIFSVQIDSFCPMNPDRFVTSKLHTLRLDDNLIEPGSTPALAFYCLSSMEAVVT